LGDILDLGDLMWSGKSERHQWRALNALEEVAPRTWFYSGFANMSAFETGEGLLVVDPGARNNAADKYAALREVSEAPLHTAVYTHGHQDHIWGVEHYRADAEARGAPRPRVVAHEGVLARFDRYRKTTGTTASSTSASSAAARGRLAGRQTTSNRMSSTATPWT